MCHIYNIYIAIIQSHCFVNVELMTTIDSEMIDTVSLLGIVTYVTTDMFFSNNCLGARIINHKDLC